MKTEQPPLAIAADNVIGNCLAVKDGEVVAVWTDIPNEERMKIGRSFWQAAQKRGAEAIYVERLPRKNSGEEPPVSIAALTATSDVVLCPTTKSLTHTKARRNACRRNARIATLPGITHIGRLNTPVRLVVRKGIAKVITDCEAARKFDKSAAAPKTLLRNGAGSISIW